MEDLFGQNGTAPTWVLTKSQSKTRLWVDNTGLFRVRGRLELVSRDMIRIQKENGNTCTVPMRRLSQADAEYVQTWIKRLELKFAQTTPVH